MLRTKDLWMEEMRSRYNAAFCRGVAKLKIPETGEVFEVRPEDLDWESECVDSDRGMGEEYRHYATVSLKSKEDDHQLEVTWNISEYPIGAVNHVYHEISGGELEKDFDDFQIPPEDLEKYVDEDQLEAILANTKFYDTFSNEISNLRELNKIHIDAPNVLRTLKRQIFIGAVTCLETYLSDAFINTVLSNRTFLEAFFSTYEPFEKVKIGLNQLFDSVNRAEDLAKAEMLKVIYHKLPKVGNMYKLTLGINLPTNDEILRDIATRHDLVHRNGKTSEGDEVEIDENTVNEVINRIEIFVGTLDQLLREIAGM